MKSLEKGNITIRGKVVSRSTAPTRKVSPFKSPKNSDFSLVISNTYSKMLKLTSTKKGSLAPFWGLKYKNAKLKTKMSRLRSLKVYPSRISRHSDISSVTFMCDTLGVKIGFFFLTDLLVNPKNAMLIDISWGFREVISSTALYLDTKNWNNPRSIFGK